MNTPPQKKAIEELLSEFDTEMDRLRKKFHNTLQKYESSRVEHLKKVISKIQSLE